MSFGPRLNEIYEKKKASLYLYAKQLAEEALKEMQDFQATNEFESSGLGWDNETKQAMQRLFSDSFMEDDSVGFFLAHAVEYGVYLELANDRKHELLRPTAEKYALRFKLYAQELFGGAA